MLLVGTLWLGFNGLRKKGTVKVGDGDLIALLAVSFIFVYTFLSTGVVYSAGVLLWVLGMLLQFDRATIRYATADSETGNIIRGTILLYEDEPKVLTHTGSKPEVQYKEK